MFIVQQNSELLKDLKITIFIILLIRQFRLVGEGVVTAWTGFIEKEGVSRHVFFLANSLLIFMSFKGRIV